MCFSAIFLLSFSQLILRNVNIEDFATRTIDFHSINAAEEVEETVVDVIIRDDEKVLSTAKMSPT